jgi:hypothetical protein
VLDVISLGIVFPSTPFPQLSIMLSSSPFSFCLFFHEVKEKNFFVNGFILKSFSSLGMILCKTSFSFE